MRERSRSRAARREFERAVEAGASALVEAASRKAAEHFGASDSTAGARVRVEPAGPRARGSWVPPGASMDDEDEPPSARRGSSARRRR